MDEGSPARKGRMRPRFGLSLRAFILLLLVLGGGFGWVGRQTHEQRDAVAAIRRAGGSVRYRWDLMGSTIAPDARLRWPGWLVSAVDFFDSVVLIEFSERSSDEDLALVRRFPHLEFLSVGSDVSDAGLVHLRGASRLRGLYLGRSRVTGAGLAHLRGLVGLRHLGLDATRVDDEGLAHLEGLRNLEWLALSETAVSDAGLRHLSGLTRLQSLSLDSTRITDAGLSHLEKLTRLEALSLSLNRIGDAGLAHLTGLSRLGLLHLSLTELTDDGLLQLTPLQRLRELTVSHTGVTRAGIARLQKAIPSLKSSDL